MAEEVGTAPELRPQVPWRCDPEATAPAAADLFATVSGDSPEHFELLDTLLESPRVIFLGETHGNRNSPALTAHLLEAKLATHEKVTVGLELPAMFDHFDAYLRSAGTEDDVERLLDVSFWSVEFADGRSSQAMLELLEYLRLLREACLDVEFLAFDRRSGPDHQKGRQLMAEAIIDHARAHPDRPTVILGGNFHARHAPFAFDDEEIVPVAGFVSRALENVTTIKIAYDGGSSMARTAEAGFTELELTPSSSSLPHGLYPYRHDDQAFDLEWAVGPAEPSPPARDEFDRTVRR